MTPQECLKLFEYDAWANERSRNACATLSSEQFTRDMGSSFASVRDTLVHIFGAQWIWLERFHGRVPAGLPAPQDFADLPAVRTRGAEVQRDLLNFVNGLSGEDLEEDFEYATLKGNKFRNPRWAVLQHLANHGTYHRGQVAVLLRQLGATPASTDLIAFYRERASAGR